jgi:predicted LPLAT superfamily acyltransferase
MSTERRWVAAERGSLAGLRLMAWLYQLFGRRASLALLYPIAAYFFLREGSRSASHRYLARVWAHP